MESTMTVAEAARNFPDLIDRISGRGDTAILTRNGSVVARIVPELPQAKRRTGKFLEMRSKLPRLGADEAEEFARDIENGRSLFNTPSTDPWAE